MGMLDQHRAKILEIQGYSHQHTNLSHEFSLACFSALEVDDLLMQPVELEEPIAHPPTASTLQHATAALALGMFKAV